MHTHTCFYHPFVGRGEMKMKGIFPFDGHKQFIPDGKKLIIKT